MTDNLAGRNDMHMCRCGHQRDHHLHHDKGLAYCKLCEACEDYAEVEQPDHTHTWEHYNFGWACNSCPVWWIDWFLAGQRERGWPDLHPEHICHRCGGTNVSSWFVDSDRFNMAMGPYEQHPHNGIVCPGCFVELHEKATGLQTTWTLVPAPGFHFRPKEQD